MHAWQHSDCPPVADLILVVHTNSTMHNVIFTPCPKSGRRRVRLTGQIPPRHPPLHPSNILSHTTPHTLFHHKYLDSRQLSRLVNNHFCCLPILSRIRRLTASQCRCTTDGIIIIPPWYRAYCPAISPVCRSPSSSSDLFTY